MSYRQRFPRPLRALAAWVSLVPALLVPAVACSPRNDAAGRRTSDAPMSQEPSDGYADERRGMVDQQIAARGVTDPRVLQAMRTVPRHRFIGPTDPREAYGDHPLPIGHRQTISQPYIVAYMLELARIEPHERVLEVGSGCGYQAAVLAELAREVYTIEIIGALAECARQSLAETGYENVHVRHGDGYGGWPQHAPFDAIVVAAAPDHVPPALVEQLAVGGRLVLPVGTWNQEIRVVTKTAEGTTEERLIPVRFVPLTRDPGRN